MKQVWPLVCAVLIALSVGGEAHAAMWFQAKGAIAHDQRYRDRGNSGGNQDNSGGRNNGGRSDLRGNDSWGEDRRDNRINRATDIARSRGHVLDAGQQSGSIFWVRVATDHGRVDLLIDTDTGQIIGEK